MRTNLGFSFVRIFTLLSAAALCAACGDDGGAAADGGTDAGTDAGIDWEGVAIESASAPDELTVVVTFGGAPPPAEAADAAIYAFSSEVGGLAVESIAYDETARTATLTTEKQKLGVRYTVTVTPPADGAAPLVDDFPSANTATFWTAEFSSGGEFEFVQKTAARFAIGESSVVYVEVGHYAPAESMIQAFDDQTYPIETEMFIDAPDQDGNGKIVLLGADIGPFVGGYNGPWDALSEEEAVELGYHSNEMEMIVVNPTLGFSDDYYDVTVAHEFNHLLYTEGHEVAIWGYHAEGLAECAVQAVMGAYDNPVDSYFSDASDLVAQGLSLVEWEYDAYERYAVAFLFWSYVAAQLGGIDAYGDIFDLATGSPEEVDAFLLERLGRDFGQVLLDQMIATYVQAETGVYGYEGLIDLGGMTPPTALPGDASYDLKPFAGTYFELDQASVDYPGTQGEHIVYAGITGTGAVDLEAPFDITDGALVVLNTNLDWAGYPTEHSGPDVPAADDGKGPGASRSGASPTWSDPPPFDPRNPAPFEEWLEAARNRVDEE